MSWLRRSWGRSYPDLRFRKRKSTKLLRVLRGGGVKTVSYLPDDGTTELVTSQFLVETLPNPTLQFYINQTPRWHNVAFTLIEVRPHA